MATQKQILANRRNGQMSTGPRTAEGKSVCRLNALRHGLTGQIDVRIPEEQAAHDQFCDTIIASLHPEGARKPVRSLEQNTFAITATFHSSDGDTGTSDLDNALAYARTYIAAASTATCRAASSNSWTSRPSATPLNPGPRPKTTRLAPKPSKKNASSPNSPNLKDSLRFPGPEWLRFFNRRNRCRHLPQARLEAARRLSQPRHVNRMPPFDNGHAPAYPNVRQIK
jgi:hypothetical protein